MSPLKSRCPGLNRGPVIALLVGRSILLGEHTHTLLVNISFVAQRKRLSFSLIPREEMVWVPNPGTGRCTACPSSLRGIPLESVATLLTSCPDFLPLLTSWSLLTFPSPVTPLLLPCYVQPPFSSFLLTHTTNKKPWCTTEFFECLGIMKRDQHIME